MRRSATVVKVLTSENNALTGDLDDLFLLTRDFRSFPLFVDHILIMGLFIILTEHYIYYMPVPHNQSILNDSSAPN